MYFNPYLRKPDVPGASRCSFTYTSAEAMQTDDNYLGKKRYRFNKWQNISSLFPRLHSSGLLFQPNPEVPFGGMVSSFKINPADDGYIDFLFGPMNITNFDSTVGDEIMMGVGFLKYSDKWWGALQGCQLACTREIASSSKRTYYTLGNNEIPGSARTFNPANYASFRLVYETMKLSIIYTEYDASHTLVFTDTYELANDNAAEGIEYRVLFFVQTRNQAKFEIPVCRTKIDTQRLAFTPKEKIYFLENPQSFLPPVAPIRDSGVHLYKRPHSALIEDSTISVSAPTCSQEWLRMMDFLLSAGPEVCIYTDPDGYEFLVHLEDLQANSARLTGSKGVGYELTLGVDVVH